MKREDLEIGVPVVEISTGIESEIVTIQEKTDTVTILTGEWDTPWDLPSFLEHFKRRDDDER